MPAIPDYAGLMTNTANHPTHSFTGFDGRCMDCDCRPYGRHAPLPCPVAPVVTVAAQEGWTHEGLEADLAAFEGMGR